MDAILEAFKAIADGYMESDKALLKVIEELVRQHRELAHTVAELTNSVRILQDKLNNEVTKH